MFLCAVRFDLNLHVVEVSLFFFLNLVFIFGAVNLPYRWTDVVVKMILDKSANNAGFPNTGVLVQRSRTKKNRLILVLVQQENGLSPQKIFITLFCHYQEKHHSNIVVDVVLT